MEIKVGSLAIFNLDDVLVRVLQVTETDMHAVCDCERIDDGHVYPKVPIYYLDKVD